MRADLDGGSQQPLRIKLSLDGLCEAIAEDELVWRNGRAVDLVDRGQHEYDDMPGWRQFLPTGLRSRRHTMCPSHAGRAGRDVLVVVSGDRARSTPQRLWSLQLGVIQCLRIESTRS